MAEFVPPSITRRPVQRAVYEKSWNGPRTSPRDVRPPSGHYEKYDPHSEMHDRRLRSVRDECLQLTSVDMRPIPIGIDQPMSLSLGLFFASDRVITHDLRVRGTYGLVSDVACRQR